MQNISPPQRDVLERSNNSAAPSSSNRLSNGSISESAKTCVLSLKRAYDDIEPDVEKTRCMQAIRKQNEWLAKRRNKVIAKVVRRFEHVQSEAIAHWLRKLEDHERLRIKAFDEQFDRIDLNSNESSLTWTELTSLKSSFGTMVSKLQDVKPKSYFRSLRGIMHKMELSMKELDSWRAESGQARSYASDCVEVLRGSIPKPLGEMFVSPSLDFSANQKQVFYYDTETSNGEIRTTAFSTSARAITEAPAIFPGEKSCKVRGVCYVHKRLVILLLQEQEREKGADSLEDEDDEEYDPKFSLLLYAAGQNGGKCEKVATLVDDTDPEEHFSLFAGSDKDKDKTVIVVHHSKSTVIEFDLDSGERQNTKLGEQLIKGFGYHAKCRHALATFKRRAVIIPEFNDPYSWRRIETNDRNMRFANCAVSASGLLAIVCCWEPTLVGTVHLYDLFGKQITRPHAGDSGIRCLFDVLTKFDSRIALLNVHHRSELVLVYKPAFGRDLKFVQLHCKQRGFARTRVRVPSNLQVHELSYADANESVRVPEDSRLYVDEQLKVPDNSVTTSQYAHFVESESAFLYVERGSSIVLQLKKKSNSNCAELFYRPKDHEKCITGIATSRHWPNQVLLISNNSYVASVDCAHSPPRCGPFVRFSDPPTNSVSRRSFVMPTDKNRMCIAVEQSRKILELKRRTGCAWKVSKMHLLPHCQRICFFHYDEVSQRFALTVHQNTDKIEEYLVVIVNKDLNFRDCSTKALKLKFGKQSCLGVEVCLLVGSTCFVSCFVKNSLKCIFDVDTYKILNCNFEPFNISAAVVPRSCLDNRGSQLQILFFAHLKWIQEVHSFTYDSRVWESSKDSETKPGAETVFETLNEDQGSKSNQIP